MTPDRPAPLSDSERRASRLRSAAFLLIWAVNILLGLQGSPFGLIVVLGLIAVAIAVYDHKRIRALARDRLMHPNDQ